MVNKYDAYIDQASQRFGVDPTLIRSVIQAESGWNPAATSSKKAAGLMQVMEPTFNELRTKHNLGPDRYDPETSILAGTAYLGQMQDQFGKDNIDAVLGGYNAGPGRMQKVQAGQSSLPSETRQYVQRVKAGVNNMGLLGSGGGGGVRSGLLGPGATYEMSPEDQQLLDQMDRDGPKMRPPGMGPGATYEMDPAQWAKVKGTIEQFGAQQPPAAMPPAAQQPPPAAQQTPVNARIQELIASTLNAPQPQRQSSNALKMQGALESVTPLAGITNRRVSMGEVLGAVGGGIGRGEQAALAADRQQRADQFGELSNTIQVAKYQQGEAASQRQIAAANAYADQIQKVNPSLAAAVRNNPPLMDEIAKAQAQQQFQKNPDPTNQQQNAISMGLIPGTPAYNRYIESVTIPLPSPGVSITNTQEKAESQAFGTELVKEYAAVRTQAENAQKSLEQIQIAQTIPVTTGALEPLKARAGALGEALGFDKDTLAQFGLHQATNAQMFTGVMENLVLAKMQSQSGPQTESDAQRIKSTVASLGNTPEASDFLLRAGKAVAHRDISKRTFYEQYKAGRGRGSLNGVGEAWREDQATKPLVAFNPQTNKPVFMDEFVNIFVKANPGKTSEDALKVWGEKYANQ